MNIHKWFSRLFLGSLADDLHTIDHFPTQHEAGTWWHPKVILAAERHGKPFLCGPNGVPREVRITAKGNYMTVIKE